MGVAFSIWPRMFAAAGDRVCALAVDATAPNAKPAAAKVRANFRMILPPFEPARGRFRGGT
jgi:hypothetical protein